MFQEGAPQVFCVLAPGVLYPKVIDKEGEHVGCIVVPPEPWQLWALVVPFFRQPLLEELIHKTARLGKSVDVSIHFEVHPHVAYILDQVVFVVECSWYVPQLDPDVFRSVKRVAKVSNVNIESDKLSISSGEETVYYEFNYFE